MARSKHWYSVLFAKGSSTRSFMVPAACTGNAIAIGWRRLEEAQDSRDEWSLIMVSPVDSNCGGDDCCGCPECTPDDATQSLEALDNAWEDTTTLQYLMFKELDLEAPERYSFTECQWDSPVGYDCMKVLRKARELVSMLVDWDSHQDIWNAAFDQCKVFYSPQTARFTNSNLHESKECGSRGGRKP